MQRPILCLLLGCALLSVTSGQMASAQDAFSIPWHVWYVRRTATHIGSGSSYVQTYGPFATRRQALQKKVALDSNRFFGTYGFGVAEVYQATNPAAKKAYGQSFPYQAKKLGNFEIQLMKERRQSGTGQVNQTWKKQNGNAPHKMGNFEIQRIKGFGKTQTGNQSGNYDGAGNYFKQSDFNVKQRK